MGIFKGHARCTKTLVTLLYVFSEKKKEMLTIETLLMSMKYQNSLILEDNKVSHDYNFTIIAMLTISVDLTCLYLFLSRFQEYDFPYWKNKKQSAKHRRAGIFYLQSEETLCGLKVVKGIQL
jgi:hypothetical protein